MCVRSSRATFATDRGTLKLGARLSIGDLPGIPTPKKETPPKRGLSRARTWASSVARRTRLATLAPVTRSSCRRHIRSCPTAWVRSAVFLHADDDSLPVLIRAALAHVQFATIHR